ncbi:MAG: Arc family DNA-binding protein [Pseudomonadota bacterium]
MSKKKAYALRVSPEILDEMQRWADDELRSVNAQIEYVLRQALRDAGRVSGSRSTKNETEEDSRN